MPPKIATAVSIVVFGRVENAAWSGPVGTQIGSAAVSAIKGDVAKTGIDIIKRAHTMTYP